MRLSGRFAGKTGGWMPKNADVSFEFPFSSFENPARGPIKKAGARWLRLTWCCECCLDFDFATNHSGDAKYSRAQKHKAPRLRRTEKVLRGPWSPAFAARDGRIKHDPRKFTLKVRHALGQ